MTKYVRGDTVDLKATFTDSTGVVQDPSDITLNIYDPTGTLNSTKALADTTKVSTGIYYYTFAIPSDAQFGDWRYEYQGTASGKKNIISSYFTVYQTPANLYSNIEDAYRKSGITTTQISVDDMVASMRDADAWINEHLGKSWLNGQIQTDWFDTDDNSPDWNTETIPDPELDRIFLTRTPVQSITSLEEYDTSNTLVKTYTPTDYNYDPNTGVVTLINSTFGNQRYRVKAVYTYGYTSVPTNIQRLSAIQAAISALRQLLGKSWERPATLAVPNVSHSVGVITNIQDTIRQLETEKKELMETIGRRKLGFAAI